ncbi:MAG: DUF6036 family nucleotidyltransferase [Candidatus Thermoplasmatota archaeon]
MKMFDRCYIEKELKKLNAFLSRQISIYVIGGGAMGFYGLKTATKDIDVLLPSEKQASLLIETLCQSGYKKIKTKDPVYVDMKAREIIENNDGFRWDIFVNKVCGGLSFSNGMKKRAEEFKNLGNIKIFLISPEDIFIFKSVTSRARDREDMFTLFSHGLDVEVIKDEIKKQTKIDDNKGWLSYFFVGLDEMVKEYNIIFPSYDEFLSLAEKEMLETLTFNFIQKKPRTLKQLSSVLKCDKNKIEKIIEKLLRDNKIKKSKDRFYANS